MLNRIPKWVREYPYELDRAALINLANVSKGRFDHPREMVYSLYGLRDQKTIDNIIARIEQAGWECELFNDENSEYLLESKKENYTLNYDNYVSDTQFFLQIAKTYGVGYEGWHAGQ